MATESFGETVLRRRETATGPVFELIVNGVFAMDTVDTSTEVLLAKETLARVERPNDVVVGGLGLGFTVAAVLADPRVRRLRVVELSAALPDWIREGLVEPTAGVLDDPRVAVEVADISDWLPRQPAASCDLVLLDVDNGPDFLVHDSNVDIYAPAFLTETARVLRPGGIAAVWSASPSATLTEVMAGAIGPTEELLIPVSREGREFDYALYLAHLPGG